MAEITVPDQDLILIEEPALDVPAQVNRSAWTRGRKVVGMPGAEQWFFRFRVKDRSTELEDRPWRAFFLALRGVQNTFRLRVACQQRTGANPTVRTGPGNGYTIPLQGLPASAAILKAGQYMTVPLPNGHQRLVCLTADLNTNGAGQTTATFEPALGQIPAVGATVETINPFSLVNLTQPRTGWGQTDGVTAFAYDAEEAL